MKNSNHPTVTFTFTTTSTAFTTLQDADKLKSLWKLQLGTEENLAVTVGKHPAIELQVRMATAELEEAAKHFIMKCHNTGFPLADDFEASFSSSCKSEPKAQAA